MTTVRHDQMNCSIKPKGQQGPASPMNVLSVIVLHYSGRIEPFPLILTRHDCNSE